MKALNIVLADKKFLFATIAVVSIALTIVLTQSIHKSYTSSVFVYPSGSHLIKGVSTEMPEEAYLLERSGSTIPFESYPMILKSSEVLTHVAGHKYEIDIEFNKYHLDLMDYFRMDNIALAIDRLNSITSIAPAANGEYLQLSVTSKYPDLSRQMITVYIEGLEKYLRTAREKEIALMIEHLETTKAEIAESDTLSRSTRKALEKSLGDRIGMLALALENPSRDFRTVYQAHTVLNNAFVSKYFYAIPVMAGLIVSLGLLGYCWRDEYRVLKPKRRKSTGPVKLKRPAETAPAAQQTKTRTTRTRRKKPSTPRKAEKV